MINTMTADEQVHVLRQASAKATKSKASALKFLQRAGIITDVAPTDKRNSATKKKK